MDTETCALLHMGVHLEEHLRLHPAAKCLFTSDLDAKAPDQLNSNHRNNLDRHVLHAEEFRDTCDEEEELGLWCSLLAQGSSERG